MCSKYLIQAIHECWENYLLHSWIFASWKSGGIHNNSENPATRLFDRVSNKCHQVTIRQSFHIFMTFFTDVFAQNFQSEKFVCANEFSIRKSALRSLFNNRTILKSLNAGITWTCTQNKVTTQWGNFCLSRAKSTLPQSIFTELYSLPTLSETTMSLVYPTSHLPSLTKLCSPLITT